MTYKRVQNIFPGITNTEILEIYKRFNNLAVDYGTTYKTSFIAFGKVSKDEMLDIIDRKIHIFLNKHGLYNPDKYKIFRNEFNNGYRTLTINQRQIGLKHIDEKVRKAQPSIFNRFNPFGPRPQPRPESFRNPKVMTKDQMIQKIMTKVRQMNKAQLKKLLTKLNRVSLT